MTDAQFSSVRPYRNTRRYALLGGLFGLGFPLVATGIQLAASGQSVTAANIAALQAQPFLWVIDSAPIVLAAFAAFAGRRQDLLEANAHLLEAQAKELKGGQQLLEKRVLERTAELEHRDQQMLSAVQITRQLAQIRDFSELASSAVRMISDTLSDITADLYTVDPSRSEVVRVASSEGEELPDMVLRIGGQGLVGQVAASGESARTELGATGQEMAIPLLAHGRSVGVLHLRGSTPSASLATEAGIVELIADHLAAAIEASRLYGEARATVEQLQNLSGRAALTAWNEPRNDAIEAFEYTRSGIQPGKPGPAQQDPRSLNIPLELRGHRIGNISILRSTGGDWTDADRDLAAKAAAQVSLALENVRLLEETRERAAQEQMLSEFSARLGRSVDLDSLLQTAVRELAALPEVAEASVIVNPETMARDGAPAARNV